MTYIKEELERPRSATAGLVAFSGLLGFILSVIFIKFGGYFQTNISLAALFVIGCTAIGIFVPDLVLEHSYCKLSTGLNWGAFHPCWPRILLKILGFWGTVGLAAFLYWLFPEYRGGFYETYFQAFEAIAPFLAISSIIYIFIVDSVMHEPFDGYWNMALLITLQWARLNKFALRQHLLTWLVKGFFIPLMFVYLCMDLSKFIEFDISSIKTFQNFWDFSQDFLYFIDVGLATTAYVMSLRIFDTHIRSSEPTMFGWVVAMCCYQPFWSLIDRWYLSYGTGRPWGEWLWNYPVVYNIWGSSILALIAIYVWSTVIFGARFSNLTNRGIITNGPYRFSKHPAYISKNISWWLISVPFVANMSPLETIRHCFLLLLLNLIYALRAITEERHLTNDPDYVAYAQWIDQNGIFRWIKKVPILKFFSYDQNAISKL